MKKYYVFTLFFLVNTIFPQNQKETIVSSKEITNNFDETIFNWTGIFADVLEKTKLHHYKISKLADCMTKAIDTFLNALDPHSSFLDPKAYKKISEDVKGEFFGIGIVIDNTREPKDKFLTIVNIIPAGPSEKAGIQAYDKIIEIDGIPLKGMTTEEAMAKLRGERYTRVKIKILREKEKDSLDFEITRDVVRELGSLAFHIPDHNIYYVSLATFSENSVKQIKNLLMQTNKTPYKGLILDLRNNSGGSLNAAIEIAGLFLNKNSLVLTIKDRNNNIIKDHLGKEIGVYKTNQKPIAQHGLPILILINNYTASAAEILAGSLKDHSTKNNTNNPSENIMVFLVGTKSFGKGSVQTVIPVRGNCAMKITTSLYFLSNEKSIQGQGIEPDFLIEKLFPPSKEIAWFTKHYGREKALKNSIKSNVQENKEKNNKGKKSDKDTPKSWTEQIKEALAKDNQLIEAIKIINFLDLAKQTIPEKVSTRENAKKYLSHIFPTKETLELIQTKEN